MYSKVIFVFCLVGGYFLDVSCADFSCFKKFRRKHSTCGGLIKRSKITSPELCCQGGGKGFTQSTLVLLSRNKYSCEGSCRDWEKQQTKRTTPVPIKLFVCFRKYRGNDECGGQIKHSKVSTIEECCSDTGLGQGYTYSGLEQHGKNKFTCASCNSWQNNKGQPQVTTTTEPATTTEATTEWTDWGTCSATCGTGYRTRTRQCSNCNSRKQSLPCTVHFYCPIDGGWGDWMNWEPCSQECGGGARRRQRQCNAPPPRHGGQDCQGDGDEEERCNAQDCSVDGNWGPWTRFGSCSQTCGRGQMSRSRVCNNPAPSGGGNSCRGSKTDSRRCETRKCPTHGGWSTWEEWGACPGTCGQGKRARTRKCNRPRPRFGGKECDGDAEQAEICEHDTQCPVNGGWSEWSEYGTCRAKDCAKGHRLRVRECNSPRPRHRGRMCIGKSVERISCKNEDGCPQDGGWCEYNLWSSCSATCLGYKATQTRVRACYCPPPKNGGERCEGEHMEIRECEGFNICDGSPSRVGADPI